MRTQASKVLAVLVFTFCLVNSANALRLATVMGTDVLVDDVKNITWVADANLPFNNNFGYLPDPPQPLQQAGILKWDESILWIAAMNAANYLGASNWRLPSVLMVDPSCDGSALGFSVGLGCTGSEMGRLYNVEGSSELAKFSNFGDAYWTSLEFNSSGAMTFNFVSGSQGIGQKDDRNFVLAVRDGDLAPVPLPAAVWLMGSALVGLFGFKRKNTA